MPPGHDLRVEMWMNVGGVGKGLDPSEDLQVNVVGSSRRESTTRTLVDALLPRAQRHALHQLRAGAGGLDDDTARAKHQILAGHQYSETSRALPPGVAVRLQQMGLVRRRHASTILDLVEHELADHVRAALFPDHNPTSATLVITVTSPTSTATSAT